MKTNAKNFCATLSLVIPVIRTKTTIPILTCVKVEASNGRLTVTATDCEAHVAASCQCEGDLNPVCVDAASLNQLAHQATDNLEFEELETSRRLKIHGNGTARLAYLSAEEFSKWPDKPATALGINASDLADCINAVSWATDYNPKWTSTADLYKESVWVKTKDAKICACGTNSKEFAYTIRSAVCANTEFMLPSKQADLLVRSLNTGAQEISISESHLCATGENLRVAITLTDGKYIPVSLLLDQPAVKLGKLPITMLLDSLRTIKGLGRDEPYLTVTIEVLPDHFKILFETERANFERSLPFQFEGTAKLKFDVSRAIRVFSHVQDDSVASLTKSFIMFHGQDLTLALALITV